MLNLFRRAVFLTLTVGLLAFVPPAVASSVSNCGSVSYTIPHTNNHGHAALNNLTATKVTCATARSVARTFLATRKAPTNWHATSKTIVMHSHGQANTVGEEIFTRGAARVSGEIAN